MPGPGNILLLTKFIFVAFLTSAGLGAMASADGLSCINLSLKNHYKEQPLFLQLYQNSAVSAQDRSTIKDGDSNKIVLVNSLDSTDTRSFNRKGSLSVYSRYTMPFQDSVVEVEKNYYGTFMSVGSDSIFYDHSYSFEKFKQGEFTYTRWDYASPFPIILAVGDTTLNSWEWRTVQRGICISEIEFIHYQSRWSEILMNTGTTLMVLGLSSAVLVAPFVGYDYENKRMNDSRYFKAVGVSLATFTLGIPLAAIFTGKLYEINQDPMIGNEGKWNIKKN